VDILSGGHPPLGGCPSERGKPREISAHLAKIYGAQVSKETITRITDRVMEGMVSWQNRPLDRA